MGRIPDLRLSASPPCPPLRLIVGSRSMAPRRRGGIEVKGGRGHPRRPLPPCYSPPPPASYDSSARSDHAGGGGQGGVPPPHLPRTPQHRPPGQVCSGL